MLYVALVERYGKVSFRFKCADTLDSELNWPERLFEQVKSFRASFSPIKYQAAPEKPTITPTPAS